jgi:ribose transport system ATP-binding protein
MNTVTEPLLQMNLINKHFAGVQALKKVNLTLYRGEILGLIGENGAGKSTLMKILMGIELQDSGNIILRGQSVTIHNAKAAYDLGIGMVFQEQALLPNLPVYENIFLGHEEPFIRCGVLNIGAMILEAQKVLEDANLNIPPRMLLNELSYAQRQMVEIARTFFLTRSFDDQIIIILDEPTTVISEKEIAQLFTTINALRNRAAFILISHNIDEVKRFCNRICIMKDGENVGELNSAEAEVAQIQELMVGRNFSSNYYLTDQQIESEEESVLEVRDLCTANLKNISFHLKKGEILGLAGLLGCGKDMLLKSLFGDEKINSGQIYINGRHVVIRKIQDAINLRIGYLPSDRQQESVFGRLSVLTNFNVIILKNYIRRILIDIKKERAHGRKYLDKLNVKTPSIQTKLENLSGGNQQKVVIARWLAKEPMLLLMDQPTRGIDVGAKQEIYRIIRTLASGGVSILFSSDELCEVIGLSNRICILKDGKISYMLHSPKEEKPSEELVIQYM